MFEILLKNEDVIRFKAVNIHAAIAIMKKHNAISLIKITKDGLVLSRFNGIKFVKA